MSNVRKLPKQRMLGTVELWIDSLPTTGWGSINVSAISLLEAFPKSYAIYPPMLLWSKGAFCDDQWRALFSIISHEEQETLFRLVAHEFDVKVLAVNGPIPASINGDGKTSNPLRRPQEFRILYGEGGSLVQGSPKISDYDAALWVTSKQNGIDQCWAPFYTMFSQGNVTEKARILALPTLQPEIIAPSETAVVDLYAGIGYFAFSYVKAGIGLVLCWELNPWSIEGLRRGASINRWSTATAQDDDDIDTLLTNPVRDRTRLIIFPEDNIHAVKRIAKLRNSIPPIRHVNCGMLPTSAPVWKDAVAILDPSWDGWIHAHENINVKDIEARKEEIVKIFSEHAAPRHATCDHLEKVKSYGPGIVHCVLDIHIGTDPGRCGPVDNSPRA